MKCRPRKLRRNLQKRKSNFTILDTDDQKKLDRLVELNVIEQCNDLIKTSIVQKAWKDRNAPQIHGWVYGLSNGLISELITIEPNLENVHPLFRYDKDYLS